MRYYLKRYLSNFQTLSSRLLSRLPSPPTVLFQRAHVHDYDKNDLEWHSENRFVMRGKVACQQFGALWCRLRVLGASSFLTLQPSSEPPSLKLALATIVGLPIVLWVWKCAMMVLFQRKIIYMGYIPPNARTEELFRDVQPPKDISCEEVRIGGEKGITLYGILVQSMVAATRSEDPTTVMVYFQGNAGNPLSRIPLFSHLIMGPGSRSISKNISPLHNLSILSVAPRSYWKSSSKTPTERGLISDYKHVIQYAHSRFPNSKIILYGHSLGGSVAICLAATLKDREEFMFVKGLVVENPFESIPGMVKALYTSKWVPYRYLGNMAWDKWDATAETEKVAKEELDSISQIGSKLQRNEEESEDVKTERTLLGRLLKDMMVIVCEKDEIVPWEMGQSIYAASEKARSTSESEDGLGRNVVLKKALHETGWSEAKWLVEMRKYIQDVENSTK
ncbi:polyketide transferase af380 family protein [Abortiporus biennis]